MLHEEAEHVDLVGSQLVKVAAVLVGALQKKCIHHFYDYKSVIVSQVAADSLNPHICGTWNNCVSQPGIEILPYLWILLPEAEPEDQVCRHEECDGDAGHQTPHA